MLTPCISGINMEIPILTQQLMYKGIMKTDMQVAMKIIGIILVLTLVSESISVVQNSVHINLKNRVEFEL